MISTEVSRWSFTGNGTWTEAAFTGLLFDEADLVVVQTTNDAIPVVSTLILNTDYTVENNYPAPGGNVVFAAPFTSGYGLMVTRSLDILQETSLRNQGAYFAEIHEDAFDRLTMICLQLARRIEDLEAAVTALQA